MVQPRRSPVSTDRESRTIGASRRLFVRPDPDEPHGTRHTDRVVAYPGGPDSGARSSYAIRRLANRCASRDRARGTRDDRGAKSRCACDRSRTWLALVLPAARTGVAS